MLRLAARRKTQQPSVCGCPVSDYLFLLLAGAKPDSDWGVLVGELRRMLWPQGGHKRCEDVDDGIRPGCSNI